MSSFSLRNLRETCDILERHLLARHLVSPAELAVARPGSKQNPKTRSVQSWIHWHAQLIKFCDREDAGDEKSHQADGIGLDILRAEPQSVTLSVLDDTGSPKQVDIYPKSLDALLQCHAHDRALAYLAEKIEVLRISENPKHVELVAAGMAEVSYQYAMLVWIVTTPGPRSPVEGEIQPPAWILDLEPWDFLRIAQAHGVVNAQRLQALEILLSKDTEDHSSATRPSWSIFVGDLAIRMNTSEESIMKDRTLAGLLASVKASGSVQRDAMAAAKAKEPVGK